MNESVYQKAKAARGVDRSRHGRHPARKGAPRLSDRVEVVYAYSPTPGRREAFGRDFDFPLTDRFETILEDRSVDAVLILTPANTHLDLVRRCAAAGKHILLEKPVEITTARAEALVAATRAAGVRLGIVLQNRYRPACLALKKVIDEGRLGRLVGVSAVTNNWRPQSYYDEPGRGTRARGGGGVLLTQAIHTLDLMISFAGAPQEVTGFATTSPVHRWRPRTSRLPRSAMPMGPSARSAPRPVPIPVCRNVSTDRRCRRRRSRRHRTQGRVPLRRGAGSRRCAASGGARAPIRWLSRTPTIRR